ncbi:MAG: (2Fe-2S)-binding protein [Xanthomonadales bacterium]|nr:(2Fe-2S)-binding protein [Gammaproteobacteria bacterium]MBT8056070.1 (2Fe-2S)-binding protein [Gammaproteobacteria bacterium]NNJ79058.1 (2Fe-2S)-binding protein [Xanthomonadales bacterium]NNL05664.1 (2Fe-2S)-binding protein [Xanthomonadales bacterium]
MIELKINGESRQFDGDGDMPLLWFLRDELALTGTKYGCGKGLCGSCTVHLNGQAVRSCVITMSAVSGSEVTTIEGLDAEGRHPLQIAWAKHDVPQCGYCQAGQIMQAASLLATNPKPDGEAISDAMRGVICRCGTYQRIESAIKSVAGGEA